MPYLIASHILIGGLCLIELLLIIGMIRRLRQHTEQLRQVSNPVLGIGLGETPAEFQAETVSGERLNRESVRDAVVGFLSPTCEPCMSALPDFVSYAAEAGNAVAVVIAVEDEDCGDIVAELEPVAKVVVAQREASMPLAFKVKGTPTFVAMKAGKVAVGANDVQSLRATVHA
ncbi:TlpA family protein disulfide reductase [Microtetraspora malaysiensis]|uniref:TlpA family protein disulfide reductase n=1 Tax=Microtetraspora malaysiensis TaxID=161358 RepID=UPI00082AD512|nr:thioredoxin family protein [Microtetraspora malaysiensis]